MKAESVFQGVVVPSSSGGDCYYVEETARGLRLSMVDDQGF